MTKDRKACARSRKPDFYQNLKIVSELHRHASKMGVFGKDPMEGIEVDLRVARILNLIKD